MVDDADERRRNEFMRCIGAGGTLPPGAARPRHRHGEDRSTTMRNSSSDQTWGMDTQSGASTAAFSSSSNARVIDWVWAEGHRYRRQLGADQPSDIRAPASRMHASTADHVRCAGGGVRTGVDRANRAGCQAPIAGSALTPTPSAGSIIGLEVIVGPRKPRRTERAGSGTPPRSPRSVRAGRTVAVEDRPEVSLTSVMGA